MDVCRLVSVCSKSNSICGGGSRDEVEGWIRESLSMIHWERTNFSFYGYVYTRPHPFFSNQFAFKFFGSSPSFSCVWTISWNLPLFLKISMWKVNSGKYLVKLGICFMGRAAPLVLLRKRLGVFPFFFLMPLLLATNYRIKKKRKICTL